MWVITKFEGTTLWTKQGEISYRHVLSKDRADHFYAGPGLKKIGDSIIKSSFGDVFSDIRSHAEAFHNRIKDMEYDKDATKIVDKGQASGLYTQDQIGTDPTH